MQSIFISSALFAVTGLFALTRHLQLLQQNSYFPSRYCGWLKKSFKARSFVAVLMLVCSIIALLLQKQWVLLIIAALLVIRIPVAFRDYKVSIKPLVFTARIKRIYACAFLIFALLSAAFLLVNSSPLKLAVSAVIMFLSLVLPVFVLLVWLLTLPVEKLISFKYTSEAKRILKQNPNLKIIGITGSYGKTSTKFFLGRLLSEKYNVVITPENFNTPLGIVRTIREKLRPDTQVFVVEMGAKKVGDIKECCELVHPTMGIITSIGPQHLDTFKSIDNIIKTKFELADSVVSAGGRILLNTGNEYIQKKASTIQNAITYGSDNADYRAENIQYSRSGLKFDLVTKDRRIPLNTRLLGHHNVLNITAAAAAALELGVSENAIKYAVANLSPVPHRLELKSYISGSVLIDDAYNANPEGCLEAVRVLGSFEGMTKILVTPGLVELGDKEYEYNRRLGEFAARVCDIIILVGEKRSVPLADGIKSTDFDLNNLYVVKNIFEAMSKLSTLVDSNTVILIENDLPDNYAG